MSLRATDPAVHIWQALLQFHRTTLATLADDLAREGTVTLDDYDVLLQLSQAGGSMRMTELAAATLIARSSCTRIVDRLVERGFVERHSDPADLRRVTVVLTRTGRTALRTAAVTHLHGIDALFASRLTDADLTDLDRILTRLAPPHKERLPTDR